MPLLLMAAGAGLATGLWLRSEADTDGGPVGNAANLAKWLVIGGAGLWAYQRFGR